MPLNVHVPLPGPFAYSHRVRGPSPGGAVGCMLLILFPLLAAAFLAVAGAVAAVVLPIAALTLAFFTVLVAAWLPCLLLRAVSLGRVAKPETATRFLIASAWSGVVEGLIQRRPSPLTDAELFADAAADRRADTIILNQEGDS